MQMSERLTIGEFARLCGVTVKTLKHYEALGLIAPCKVDEWTRYRYYDVSQMRRVNGILQLKSMGFSLDEICGLQDEGTHKPSIPQMEEKARQTQRQIRTLQARLSTLETMTSSQKKVDRMERISVQPLPSVVVAFHRHKARSTDDLGTLFDHVINPEVQRLGCRRAQPAYYFSVKCDSEDENCGNGPPRDRYEEFCVPVDEIGTGSPLVQFKSLDAVPMAVCMKFHGTYEHLDSHFEEVRRYIRRNSLRVTGKSRTVYVEGAWNQKNPDKWLTIIQVPVAPMSKRA